ncbi:hypothetical protein EMGBS3_12010, partial [Anaerolineaceae bacterium]
WLMLPSFWVMSLGQIWAGLLGMPPAHCRL